MNPMRSFLCLLALAGLQACSDSGDDGNTESTTPNPVSIATPNADRCEILQSSNCLFPWPSNTFTVTDDAMDTGLRVDLPVASMPVNKQGVPVGVDEFNRNDGFSPSQVIVLQIPGIDLDASGATPIGDLARFADNGNPIVVIRASTGERHLVFAELDANTADPLEQTLLVRPMAQFERGERYIIALRNLVDRDGETLQADEVFAAFRDQVPTDNEAIEARRPAMEDIFALLSDSGVQRDDLYLAWDFQVASVRNITERVLHIRDEAFLALGSDAPVFIVDDVIDYSPCDPDGCADNQNEWISREVNGRLIVPNFLDSEDGGPGSAFHYAEPDDGLPDRIGGDNTLEANFICRIPRSATADFSMVPILQARPSLYGHGLLGSAGEVRRGSGGNVSIMANDHRMMFCATDWIGFSQADVGVAIEALQDMSKLRPFFDRQQQGFLNFMFLARALKLDDGFASHPAFQSGGVPVFDTRYVYYDGNSQGGILGGALMGVIQDVTRGVLGVPGMAYSLLLRRSIDFDLYSQFLSGANTGDAGGGYASVKDQSFLLSMAQMLWDRAEASGYAYHIERPLPNTPRHAVLLQVAYGDHQVSMWAAEFMTRAIGGTLRVPALESGRHPDAAPFYGIEAVPAGDFTGSVLTYWDDGPVGGGAVSGGTAPPPSTNLPPFEPDFGDDPHSLPRRDGNAQSQKSFFLMPPGQGTFVDTCEPELPCFTDGYPGGG